jgi:hypothetical protein
LNQHLWPTTGALSMKIASGCTRDMMQEYMCMMLRF